MKNKWLNAVERVARENGYKLTNSLNLCLCEKIVMDDMEKYGVKSCNEDMTMNSDYFEYLTVTGQEICGANFTYMF